MIKISTQVVGKLVALQKFFKIKRNALLLLSNKKYLGGAS
jgi:hypothetical protein